MDTAANHIDIKTGDINPVGRHPEDILSNKCHNDFCIDHIQCGSMEWFLQSLKYQDTCLQRKICAWGEADVLETLSSDWQDSQTVWWKGRAVKVGSKRYRRLIRKAYEAMYLWSARFRDVLMSTEGKELRYDSGCDDPCTTLLTDKEFCKILTDLRRANQRAYQTVLYPRMWPNSYGVEEDYI